MLSASLHETEMDNCCRGSCGREKFCPFQPMTFPVHVTLKAAFWIELHQTDFRSALNCKSPPYASETGLMFPNSVLNFLSNPHTND